MLDSASQIVVAVHHPNPRRTPQDDPTKKGRTCQCAHWGYIVAGTMRVHSADGTRDYAAGETYHWAPGHNLEAVMDAEYFEISKIADYDVLMERCRRGLAAAAEAAD